MFRMKWVTKQSWPAVALILALALLALFSATMASAHDGSVSPGVVHTCVNSSSGEIKLVEAGENCKKNSDPVDWDIVGPKGDTGDAGGRNLSNLGGVHVNSLAAGDGMSLSGVAPAIVLHDGLNQLADQRGGLGVASVANNFGIGTLPGDISLFSQVGDLKFATAGTLVNPPVRVTIDTGGDVGIGTTTPNAPLFVKGHGVPNGLERVITFKNGSASHEGWSLGQFQGSTAPGGSFSLYDENLGKSRIAVRNNNGGFVGIGIDVPEAKLHVSGGDIAVTTQGDGLILRATDGANCFRITVNNLGTLSSTSVSCP